MQSLRARIGKGSLWLTCTRGIVNLLGLISTIALARLLAPSDFGLVAIGTTMLMIVKAVTDVAMSQALVHHENPTDEHMHTAWTLNLARGVLVGGAFAASGPLIAQIFADPRLSTVMYVLGASLVLNGFTNPRRALLQKDLIFWQDFIMNVSERLVTLIVSVTIALLYHSYWALLLGTLCGQFAQVAISYTAMPFRPRFSMKHARELWSFSMWLTLTQIVNTLNWRLDNLLIGKFLGAGALGIYTVGNNLANMPTRESTLPLSRTLYPAFAKLRHDPQRLRVAYQRAQMLMTAVALPLGTGVAMVAHPLILLVMGEKWLPTVIVIQAISIVSAIQTMATLAQALAMSKGETRILFIRSTQMLITRVPFILLGMYLDGLRGVVLARVLTGTVGIFANMSIVRRMCGLGIFEQLRVNVRTLIAVLTMAGAIWLFQQWLPDHHGHIFLIAELVASALLGITVYLASMFALWIMAGKPLGPETELVSALGAVKRKLSPA